MAVYKFTTPVSVSYNVDNALITEILFGYDQGEVNIRWIQVQVNGTRRISKVTTLSGADLPAYRAAVLTRVQAGETIENAMRNAAYTALVAKESFPPGTIV